MVYVVRGHLTLTDFKLLGTEEFYLKVLEDISDIPRAPQVIDESWRQ